MASRLAQAAGVQVFQREGLFGGKSRKFYQEICRCLPFIHRTMRLDDLVTVGDLRKVVNQKFKEYKDVKDARVVDSLIFRGREELETYVTIHKQRHHIITEWLEPIVASKRAVPLPKTSDSKFLNSFYTANSAIPTGV